MQKQKQKKLFLSIFLPPYPPPSQHIIIVSIHNAILARIVINSIWLTDSIQNRYCRNITDISMNYYYELLLLIMNYELLSLLKSIKEQQRTKQQQQQQTKVSIFLESISISFCNFYRRCKYVNVFVLVSNTNTNIIVMTDTRCLQ